MRGWENYIEMCPKTQDTKVWTEGIQCPIPGSAKQSNEHWDSTKAVECTEHLEGYRLFNYFKNNFVSWGKSFSIVQFPIINVQDG